MTDDNPNQRFTISQEWVGHPTTQWVARFCGDWIGSAPTKSEAIRTAFRWNAQRLGTEQS